MNVDLGRRSLLASAAGALFLREAVGQEAVPNVEDRGSSIRITGLKAMPVGHKAYVKIETSAKVVGWGEVTGLEPQVACTLAASLLDLLKDENPTRIEHLWQKVYRSHRDMRGGPFMTHVLSAVDMALWDIAGKLYGVPVHRLLGGPVRDRIRVYPHAKAQKVATGGPKPFAGTPEEVKGILGRLEEARRKVGPDGVVIYDAHCCVPPPLLLQLAGELKPSDVLFIEEPAVPGNIEVFKRLKQAIQIPLATGERDRTIWELLPYLHERCIDILQPDCGHTGGISQMKKIAALAEAYTVPLAPHCTMSILGLTASLQAVAAIPNFLIQECYTDGQILPPGVARASWAVDKNGYASIPEGPGLGVEIDEALIASIKDDPRYKFKWPQQKLPDGTVADY